MCSQGEELKYSFGLTAQVRKKFVGGYKTKVKKTKNGGGGGRGWGSPKIVCVWGFWVVLISGKNSTSLLLMYFCPPPFFSSLFPPTPHTHFVYVPLSEIWLSQEYLSENCRVPVSELCRVPAKQQSVGTLPMPQICGLLCISQSFASLVYVDFYYYFFGGKILGEMGSSSIYHLCRNGVRDPPLIPKLWGFIG